MSRLSTDEYRNSKLWNGYDYEHQCWVLKGIIQRCGHPETMGCKCYGKVHEGDVTSCTA